MGASRAVVPDIAADVGDGRQKCTTARHGVIVPMRNRDAGQVVSVDQARIVIDIEDGVAQLQRVEYSTTEGALERLPGCSCEHQT